jgi:hypothetical protein
MKTNALLPILFIQNNKKKKIRYRHFLSDYYSVHFREILSGYFLFSRFDWSIFVTQLVAKHMKEIINLINKCFASEVINTLCDWYLKRTTRTDEEAPKLCTIRYFYTIIFLRFWVSQISINLICI